MRQTTIARSDRSAAAIYRVTRRANQAKQFTLKKPLGTRAGEETPKTPRGSKIARRCRTLTFFPPPHEPARMAAWKNSWAAGRGPSTFAMISRIIVVLRG